MNTKKLTTASTRNTPICANTSASSVHFSELLAELGAARRRSLDGAPEALGELLLLEDLERCLGRSPFGSDVFAQGRGRFVALGGELGRAENRVQRELARNLGRKPELLARSRELLDEPENIRRPARRHRGDRVEQPLLLHPDDFPHRAQDRPGLFLLLVADVGQRE